jgi:hypothetical protein
MPSLRAESPLYPSPGQRLGLNRKKTICALKGQNKNRLHCFQGFMLPLQGENSSPVLVTGTPKFKNQII